MKEGKYKIRKILAIGTVVALLMIGLSGCAENDKRNIKNRFIGTWTSTGGAFYMDIIVLYSDGTASYTHHGSSEDYVHPATWDVQGNKLLVNETEIGRVETFTYRFSNDETLILIMDPAYYGEWETIYKKT